MRATKAKDIRRKTFLLSESLIKRAQKALDTKTETAAVTQALEDVVFEQQARRALRKAAGKGVGHFDLTLQEDWTN